MATQVALTPPFGRCKVSRANLSASEQHYLAANEIKGAVQTLSGNPVHTRLQKRISAPAVLHQKDS